MTTAYALAADAVLLLHVLFVLFLVGGQLLVLVGWARRWSWIRNPWFRLAHLLGILVVSVQAWGGVICFLTNWEMALRARAGDAVYSGSFIAHWLQSLLYYQAPVWVFAVCYTGFALLVAASWAMVPPRRFRHGEGRS